MGNNLKIRWIISGLIVILLAGVLYFGFQVKFLTAELENAKKEIAVTQTNEKVLNFTGLFIEKVLKSDSEVDFDTRLKLENAVREIHDDLIFSLWDKFVKSKTEAEAQKVVKDLLGVLISKIQ